MLSWFVAELPLSVRRLAATAKATRLCRERLKQADDAVTADALGREQKSSLLSAFLGVTHAKF